ncbi:MAG: DUF924 family protein [Leptolyngbyaceae cyanobacterium]
MGSENRTDRLPPDARKILNFWFDDPAVADSEYGQERRIWFHKDPAFDQHVREQFMDNYEQARQGVYDDWLQTARSALALIVLLDQFPRNMFRGTPRSFEADSQALSVAQAAIARGYDRSLMPVERIFLYLPFEHSENLKHQDQSVAFFKSLIHAAPELQSSLEYAHRHHDVVARFGRFPHRKTILGRTSTPAEIEFLKQRGARF